MKKLALFLIVAVGLAIPAQSAELDSQLLQERRTFGTTLKQHLSLQYLLHLPEDYGKNRQDWPLILFLHGAGERGDDLSKVEIHGPPMLISRSPRARKGETEEHKSARLRAIRLLKEKFVIVSPQCPTGEHWRAQAVSALLDHIEETLPIDKKRIYLTGLSMGGYGTWELGLQQPGRFAALAPICGGANTIVPLLNHRHPERKPQQINLPIWAFHGGKDSLVVPNEAERVVNLLRKYGNKKIKLTVYPDATHDSWTATYANPELYEWFLANSKK